VENYRTAKVKGQCHKTNPHLRGFINVHISVKFEVHTFISLTAFLMLKQMLKP